MDKTLQQKQFPTKEERHRLFGSVRPGPKTKPVEKEKMSDLQNVSKDFLFPLDAVGIANVKHPIIVNSELKPNSQTTIGNFQFSSSISKTSKGTNMSRFTEQLHHYHKQGLTTDFSLLKKFIIELAERLEQDDASMEITFPWFYERSGPHSQLSGMNHTDVMINVDYNKETGVTFTSSLSVLITTLCPCSKDISEYSAHNQRGLVTMDISFTDDFDDDRDWKKDLLNAAESNASSPLHPVLKRPDEKMITERAYENPRFVEDIVRLVAADLYELPFVSKFRVVCQKQE